MLKRFNNVKVGYLPSTEVEINNKKYLIHNVIDGEDIEVETEGRYPSLSKVIKPSEHRVNNGCPYQKECGGCQFMHVSYEYEQKLKTDFLNDLFKPFIENVKLNAMFEPTHYRNKCQMTYKLSKSNKVVCGFYEEYSHRLVTVSDCMLQSRQANKIIAELNKILSKHKIMPYDEKTRQGIIRHVYVRYGFNTKESMVVIVTNGEFFPGRNNVLKDLLKLDLAITTVIQNYNHRDTSIVLGEENKVLYGPGFIYEKVGNYKFKISPNSFFQVNTFGMKKLYDKAMEMAEIKKTDRVIDAYCGVGTISIFASKFAKEVIGVELNKQAIKDAKINQKINNIDNINFIADDATNFMTHMAKERFDVDVVIMDPPREGSTKQFINAIGYLKPKKVVYISCDPKTMKRDLYDFGENDYYVTKLEAFDNFSKTQHLECIALLERINK